MNIGLLKLELLHHGINQGPNLPQTITNPFGLVHLVLPKGLPVSIHLNDLSDRSPYTLVSQDGDFFVTAGQERTPVRWTPPLRCYEKRTSGGVPVGEILTVHGGLIAVHPKNPCRFGLSGLTCRYCGSTRELSKHPPFTKQDLVEALQIVLAEKRCDIVQLSSGHVESADGGVEWLGPWVAELRRHLNLLISLDLVPPQTNDWIDKAYAMGVDALYYDTDFFDPRQMAKPASDRRRQIEALSYAAQIFPRGAVLSHLVIGLEPLDETKRMIDELINCGAVPILVYFPPTRGTELARRWTVRPDQLGGLYAHLFERLRDMRITPHWIQQFDVVLTPLEARFFSSRSPGYFLTLKNFYDTGLGRAVRFGLAGLRRHLRVREVPAP